MIVINTILLFEKFCLIYVFQNIVHSNKILITKVEILIYCKICSNKKMITLTIKKISNSNMK